MATSRATSAASKRPPRGVCAYVNTCTAAAAAAAAAACGVDARRCAGNERGGRVVVHWRFRQRRPSRRDALDSGWGRSLHSWERLRGAHVAFAVVAGLRRAVGDGSWVRVRNTARGTSWLMGAIVERQGNRAEQTLSLLIWLWTLYATQTRVRCRMPGGASCISPIAPASRSTRYACCACVRKHAMIRRVM